MKNILTELYYGNIDAQNRNSNSDSDMKEQVNILSECEAMLIEKLTGEEKEAFLNYANASNIVLGESEHDSFLVGFRLGARFAYDTFVDKSAPLDERLMKAIIDGEIPH